jgi:hypothetical protein
MADLPPTNVGRLVVLGAGQAASVPCCCNLPSGTSAVRLVLVLSIIATHCLRTSDGRISDLSPISLFLTVGCGFYFYLKVVRAMYWQPAPVDATAIPVSRLSLVAMWIMVGLIFVFGIFPQVAVGLLPRRWETRIGVWAYRRVRGSGSEWLEPRISRHGD